MLYFKLRAVLFFEPQRVAYLHGTAVHLGDTGSSAMRLRLVGFFQFGYKSLE